MHVGEHQDTGQINTKGVPSVFIDFFKHKTLRWFYKPKIDEVNEVVLPERRRRKHMLIRLVPNE